MKKRHQQKLVVISCALFLMLNVPLVLVFDHTGQVFGFPIFYFSIFVIWIMSIVTSFIILQKHYE